MLRANTAWMTPNLLLAAVPFALAVVLFGPRRQRTIAWWVGVAVFVAFLPNAPYVLTDLVHLSGQVRHARTDAQVLGLYVEYGVLIGAGVTLYGGCLYLLRRRLAAEGYAHWRWPAEVGLHVLCSIGIFLGRVLRLNSWDVVVSPGSVLQYVGIPKASTVVLLLFTFCVLVLTTLALRVPLAIHDQRRASR